MQQEGIQHRKKDYIQEEKSSNLIKPTRLYKILHKS